MTEPRPAARLVRELTWAASAVHAHGDRAAGTAGQSLARWQVLDSFATVHRTVPAAARRLRQSRQSVQRIVDILVNEGLLTASPNPDHRNSPLYGTTGDGTRMLDALDSSAMHWQQFIASKMPEADLLRLIDLLAQLRAVADEYTAPASTPAE